VINGARWIARKRVDQDDDSPHAGLLPPGFSAEHLGPNDYYYWDDFWSVAGLRSAVQLADALDEPRAAEEFRREADSLSESIDQSLRRVSPEQGGRAMPASPYRRMDAGAVGSIVAGYPLQLMDSDDPRLLETTEFLLSECLVNGGFFHNIIHSGINAYLTLHIAQVLMRAGDTRALDLVQKVADLASPTGQWPEAIHPRTGGGCMGDGQHGWAAAEWVMILRNSFVREEGGHLVAGAGIDPRWLDRGETLRISRAPTAFGEVGITFEPRGKEVSVNWQGDWHDRPCEIRFEVPGCQPVRADGRKGEVTLRRANSEVVPWVIQGGRQ
jgi:hypothetical protein